MGKIAILGVHGSGKTVMLAGLGAFFEKADDTGCFLVPESRDTLTYVKKMYASLKQGRWPGATVPETLTELQWSLRRRASERAPVVLGDLSVLDFGGEAYEVAFEGVKSSRKELASAVAALRQYVSGATEMVVLLNLSDLIVNGEDDPSVQSVLWSTKKILDYAGAAVGNGGDMCHRVALVFTQADRYAATIARMGGPRRLYEELLPMISQSYCGIDVLTAYVVDHTDLDDDGNEVPHLGNGEGLKDLWRWILSRCSGSGVAVQGARQGDASAIVEEIRKEISHRDLYFPPNIPASKQQNAVAAMNIREPVLMLFDSTVFGGSEEGMVITSKAIYTKDLFADPHRIEWNSVNGVVAKNNTIEFSTRKGGSTVLMNGMDNETARRLAGIINLCVKGSV